MDQSDNEGNQKSKEGNVFKNILNQFSRFPHIKKNGQIYPIDLDEIPPDEEISVKALKRNEQIRLNNLKRREQKKNEKKRKSQFYITELVPEEAQQGYERSQEQDQQEKLDELKDRRFQLLKNLDPQQFLDIKNEFNMYQQEGGVDINHFIAIMCEVLCYTKSYSSQLDDQIQLFIEIFRLIDVENQGQITFEKFSNFIITLEEIISRDQRLYEVKIKQIVKENNIDHFPIQKLFALEGLNCFGLLQQSLKFLKLIDTKQMATVENINLGSSTINAAGYIKDREVLIISSNDQFLNFFDVSEKKLLRRFQVPEIQLHIEVCPDKNIFYTANSTGTIYSWSIDKIFQPGFEQRALKEDRIFQKAWHEQPVRDQYDVTVMKNCEILGCLLTGSNDTIVRMYENKRQFTGEIQEFRGHIQGIKGIDFCAQLKLIVSCSYEFDIFVWNAYLDHPVIKLTGHEAPIVNVICPAEVGEVILSGDSQGIIQLWNARNFDLLQTVNTSDGTPGYRLQGLVYRKKYKRLVFGAKKVFFYDFEDSFDPELTDDRTIFSMIYSQIHLEMITASGRTVKVWNLRQGILSRLFKDVVHSDITCLALDNLERKLFVSTHQGEMACIDILTGLIIKKMQDHVQEVSFMEYCSDLKTIQNVYECDLMGGACSENLLLIASIGRESDLRLWDLEKALFSQRLTCQAGSQFVKVIFLDPLPMMMASDVTGNMYIWATRPHRYENKLLFQWKNMEKDIESAQVTSFTHIYNENDNKLIIILGDEKGRLKIIDLSQILEDCKIIRATARGEHTNVYRIRETNFAESELQYISQKEVIPLIYSEQTIKTVKEWLAHQGPINSIIQIDESRKTTIITMGADKQVKLWSLDDGQNLGMLKQGTQYNQNWKFELKKTYIDFVTGKFDEIRSIKKDQQQIMLNQIIKERKAIRFDMIVPFQKDDDPDYKRALLDRVDSREILENIKEVDQYLERKQNSNNNKSFSFY